MRRFRALLLPVLAPALCLAASPVAAQAIVYGDVAQAELVWLDLGHYQSAPFTPARAPQAIAAYGPFRVIDSAHAALVKVTDDASPAAFAAMMLAYPRISVLTLINCPGTENDLANLQLGLMIRERQIVTYAPKGSLVASGAVELFLAGVRRYADPGAKFVVHSWKDTSGRGPGDYPRNGPKNRTYIDYYRTMGLSEAEARAFYAMTNSVPFSEEKWLTRDDLARWVQLDSPSAQPPVQPAPSRTARNARTATLR